MRQLVGKVAFIAFALLAAACAGVGGGPSGKWREVRTPHFAIHTDLESRRAAELAEQLELVRAAMLAVAWPYAKGPPGQIEIAIFAHPTQMSRFLPVGASATHNRQGDFESLIVFSPRGSVGIPSAVPHELAHAISSWMMPLQPTWFAEGLATFLESVRYDEARHLATMGAVPEGLVRILRAPPMPPSELLQASSISAEPRANSGFYLGAWLFVRYLLNERGDEFGRFQVALGELQPWRSAWSREFGNHALSLDEAVVRNYHYDVQWLMNRPFTFQRPQLTQRELSTAEAHGLFAHLAVVQGVGDAAYVEQEVKSALASAPGNLDALSAAFHGLRLPLARRRAFARRALDAHLDSAVAWCMAADVAALPMEALQAAARAAQLNPYLPGARTRLAYAKIMVGYAGAALPDTSLAIRLGAPNSRLLAMHVVALAANGRCLEAIHLAETRMARVQSNDPLYPHVARAEQNCSLQRWGKP